MGQAGNRWEFTAFIRDALDTAGKSPQPFHRRIVALVQERQIKTVVTTAYDNLLELAFQEASFGINRVVRDSDVSFINPDRPTLLKLYGDAHQPDTLVVTNRDHSDLLRDREREPLLDEVRRAFRRNTVLFVGYNLADPDFRFLFDQVAESRFARTAYAVWPGLPETDVQMWRDRGIVIIEADPWGLVGAPDSSIPHHPTAADLRQFLEKDYRQLEEALNDVHVSMGESPLVKSAASFNWQRLTSHFNVPQDVDTLFCTIYETREIGWGGVTKLTAEQLRSARQGIERILEFLHVQFPDAGVKTLPSRQKTTIQLPKTSGVSEGANPPPLYGAGNHWAVLVGVNEYEDKANYGRLRVCVKDVHALRDQLAAGGFEQARIRLLTDDTPEPPTRNNILVALKAVADATEPDDLLLFYYSGHGDERGGESYLVARDGRWLVLDDTAVRLSRVKEIVEGAPARAKIIILDACHSGADIGGKGPKPMSADFIRRVFEQAEGLAVLASCKQGQFSYEWPENERSVFTHFLLEALEGQADRDDKGLVTMQDANRHVTDGVKLWASQHNKSQTPTLESKSAGDIILVRYP